MADCRVWTQPDGTIKVQRFARGITAEQRADSVQTLLDDKRVDPASTFEDGDDAVLVPTDRTKRHKWRKNPSGPGVIVDPTVPDLPNPKQALRDQLDQATTVAHLKTILRALLP